MLVHDRPGIHRNDGLRGRWTVPCPVVTGPTERYDAFATSRAVIAKSGTVTLELALAGVPMVVCYKVCAITGLGTQGASGARANEINLLF